MNNISSHLLILPALIGLLFACDSSSPSREPISPDVLKAGASWTYEVHLTTSPVDSSVVDTVLRTTVQLQVANTDAEIGSRSGLVELEAFELSAPDTIERKWYDQSPDSLVAVAYTTPPRIDGTPPFLRSKAEPSAQHVERGLMGLPILVRRYLESTPSPPKVATDTIVRDDSRIVLQAPLEQGASWTSFRAPFLSTRTVTGRTIVETRTGIFDALEIETNLPERSPSLQWSDYYTEDGLVRRVLTDTLEGRNSEGDPIGEYVSREHYELVELNK